MTEAGKKYLSDILIAIDRVELFLNETADFASYETDIKTQSATERQLAIIGEALNKFKRTDPDVLFTHDKQIISFRNRLVHAYDSIDNAIVWMILKKHLHELKTEIKEIYPDYEL